MTETLAEGTSVRIDSPNSAFHGMTGVVYRTAVRHSIYGTISKTWVTIGRTDFPIDFSTNEVREVHRHVTTDRARAATGHQCRGRTTGLNDR